MTKFTENSGGSIEIRQLATVREMPASRQSTASASDAGVMSVVVRGRADRRGAIDVCNRLRAYRGENQNDRRLVDRFIVAPVTVVDGE